MKVWQQTNLILHSVWQEISELHEQVGMVCEELRDLLKHFFDAFLLLLVSVKNLQERSAV
jgi:hypothetical protein